MTPPGSPIVRCFVFAVLLLAGRTAGVGASPFDTDLTPGGPMPAREAAAGMTLPPGFHATVFAAEPDVRQPIAMATDTRGRLWVAENYTYSEREVAWHPEFRDRILIFEDTDNDGRYDKRTVFKDGLQRLTTLEIGFGGVWAICLPELIFFPDRNGDDVPDGPPEVILDGFEYVKGRHTFANGLRWGPDGWLYGRQGIQHYSKVGTPGTPDAQRVPFNVGIWRMHPQRHTFEAVAEGTTNPWGMDWDRHGELFFINTVIGHLWHAIPGAHFRRMSGDDPNPRLHEILEQYADHVHWATGEVWTDVRKGVSNATLAAGGGHAHTGMIIYQGGQWPDYWADKLLTVNFHGRRLNVERFARQGSALIGQREPDAFLFPDPRFRGLDLLAAPDGGVYVSDWNDAGECHDNDGIHRSSGRIFKLTYGAPPPGPLRDVATLDAGALAELQRSANDWQARQARRVLADRAAQGADLAAAQVKLAALLGSDAPVEHRLRALWAQYAARMPLANILPALLSDREEYLRGWAIRLLVDERPAHLAAPVLDTLVSLARTDPSAVVRLALTSALQRLPAPARATLAAPLLAHAEDATDHNLPLMLWYGIEPLAEAPGAAFESLVAGARIPRVQRLAMRRLAEDFERAPARIDALLTALADQPVDARQAALDGLAQGLSGRHHVPKPAAWDALQTRYASGATAALRLRLRDLSALFGDERAIAEVRRVALDSASPLPSRRAALDVLVGVRAPGLQAVATELLHVRNLTAAAAAGLAPFDDPAIADTILAEWPRMYGIERPAVMNVLLARKAWAAKALDALDAGRLQRGDFSATQIRQIRALRDPALTRRMDVHLVASRGAAEIAPAAQLATWTARLSPTQLEAADRTHGRAVFTQLCGACHILNGEGGAIGPDLTGAARDSLGYLLDNILFPSAVVPDDYRLTTLTLKDGRTLAGMVRSRSGRTLKLQTMTELVALSADEVAKEETLPQSLMPPGLLDGIPAGDALDLIAYLMTK